MFSWLRRNPRWSIPGAVIVIGVGAWLAFGYFGFQTYFFDDKVNEGGPVFASAAEQAEATAESADATAESADATAESGDAATVDGDAAVGDTAADESTTTITTTTTAAPAEVVVQYTGTFMDRSHPSEGVAQVLNDGSAQRFLRLEEFATDNGPDLNVYLSAAPPDAPADQFDDDFVDLGNLKGNIGDQNYEIPEDVDLDRYSTVVIWCVRFAVAFGSAGLTVT